MEFARAAAAGVAGLDQVARQVGETVPPGALVNQGHHALVRFICASSRSWVFDFGIHQRADSICRVFFMPSAIPFYQPYYPASGARLNRLLSLPSAPLKSAPGDCQPDPEASRGARAAT